MYFGNSTSSPNFATFGSSNGDFTLRNGGSGIGTGGPEIGPAQLGQTFLLVARILKNGTPNYSRAEMWVNPTLTADNLLPAPTLSGNFTSTQSSVASFGARSANLDANEPYLMDQFLYGTDVSDVVPGAVGVTPEPGTALAGLSALSLLWLRPRTRRTH